MSEDISEISDIAKFTHPSEMASEPFFVGYQKQMNARLAMRALANSKRQVTIYRGTTVIRE